MISESSKELMEILEKFAVRYVDQIDRSNIDWMLETAAADDSSNAEEFVGFDVALQLVYASYLNMVQTKINKKGSRSSPFRKFFPRSSPSNSFYVPETPNLFSNEESQKKKKKEKKKFCIPETAPFSEANPSEEEEQQQQREMSQSPILSGSSESRRIINEKKIRRLSLDFFGPEEKDEENSKSEDNSDKVRDDSVKIKRKIEGGTRIEDESPSILKPSVIQKNCDDDDFDFLDDELSKKRKNEEDAENAAIFSRKKSKKKGENKWGIEVEAMSPSKLTSLRRRQQTMRQGKVDAFFKKAAAAKKKEEEEDDEDLKRAVRDSLEIEENKSPNFKYVGETVRGKEARKLLQGFDCPDCREFYRGQNLTEEQVKKLLKECSRHRAKCAPPADSPKERWELEISDDDFNKTQVGPPLRTRRLRKL